MFISKSNNKMAWKKSGSFKREKENFLSDLIVISDRLTI